MCEASLSAESLLEETSRWIMVSHGRKEDLRSYRVPPQFDWDLKNYNFDVPSSRAYQVEGGAREFIGPFLDIRSGLDFDYHGCYTKERQHLQDSLINDCILEGTLHEDPWIIFTAGAMGAGKGFVMDWMSRNGYFPLPDIVHVDPDRFRTALPEWDGYKQRDPSRAGSMTHLESGYIAEIAQEASLRMRKHTWVDGSLRDGDWYAQVFKTLRAKHPEYRIAILHITASWEMVQNRAESRGTVTGRFVPVEQLRDSFDRVPQAVKQLTPLADFVAEISNDSTIKLMSTWDHTAQYHSPHWTEVGARFADLKALNDLPLYRGAVLDVIKVLVKSTPLLIFGKSYDSFTTRLVQLLDTQGSDYKLLILDKMAIQEHKVEMPNGNTPCGVAFQVLLQGYSGIASIPQVSLSGKFIGGFEEATKILGLSPTVS